jgi:hypothetical protein
MTESDPPASEEPVPEPSPPSGPATATGPLPDTRGSSLRRTIADRSIQGKAIFITRNAHPRTTPRLYRLVSFEKLFADAVRICQLNNKAVRAFNADGVAITSVDDVQQQETLFISSGEPFARAASSPSRTRRTAPPAPATARPAREPEPESPTKTLRTKQERLQAEIASFQRLVAFSRRSVDEALVESAASVFAGLDRAQQARLASIGRTHDDCQLQLFLNHLLALGIAPTTPNLHPATVAYAQGAFHRVRLEDVRFVIDGPRQSGKTTLLYQLASVLARKLQVSEAASQYLWFPLNCELAMLELEDVHRLLRLFLRTVFQAVEYSSLRLLPVLEELRAWFFVSVFGAAVPVPKAVAASPFVDVEAVTALALKLKTALRADKDAKTQKDDSLQRFLKKLCSFPNNFAKAVGLRGAIFVIDAFEDSDAILMPQPGAFPRSLRPSKLSEVLSTKIMKCPYLVSMRDEQRFFESFLPQDAMLISTEGLVPLERIDEVSINDPIGGTGGLTLRTSDCRGYPGYVSRFERIADLVQGHAERVAIASQYALFRTAADLSRLKAIRFEVAALAGLLTAARYEGFDRGIGSVQNIIVKLVRQKEEPDPRARKGLWAPDPTVDVE